LWSASSTRQHDVATCPTTCTAPSAPTASASCRDGPPLLRHPKFILGQALLVAVWIALNAIAVSLRWDPYKAAADDIGPIADAQRRHVEQQTGGLRALERANTALTERIAAVTS
jgi:hypothetical protein